MGTHATIRLEHVTKRFPSGLIDTRFVKKALERK
jgi:hypothetical protein